MTSGDREGQPRADIAVAKATLRSRLRAARGVRGVDVAGNTARTQRVLAACAGSDVIAAYASIPGEPDTLTLIEQLRLAGVKVLLPVLRRAPDWAWYTGPDALAAGPLGIPQPTGPALGAAALVRADRIWLPGLAGTPSGDRLGTGGGWYDRALGYAAADAIRGLLLFDDEVLAELPTDSWDQPVHLLVTERRQVECRPE